MGAAATAAAGAGCCGGCNAGLGGMARLTPAARLAKEAGGRLMLARIGLAGLFLARHSSQLAISGSLLSPKHSKSKVKILILGNFDQYQEKRQQLTKIM